MKTLVIIPAYNEAENIVRVVDHLIANYPQYDYIIVNDGSRDETPAICRAHGYRLLDLPVNLGLAGAFQAGMRYARRNGYDAAIQFDADGQHRAEYIAPLVAKLAEGYHVAIGSRFVTVPKPISLRMLGSFLISFAIRFTTGQKLTDPTSGMRVYDKAMIYQYARNVNRAPEPDTLSYLMKQGAKVAEVQVEMDERIAGESYLDFTRSMAYMLRMGVSIVLVQPFRGKLDIPAAQKGEATA